MRRLTALPAPPPRLKAWPASAVDVLQNRAIGRHGIADVQYVADLASVPVDRDRLIAERADQEVRDPALVFGAELARPVDAALAQDGGAQTEGMGVVEDVLVGGSFRTAVRGAERKRAGLVDAAIADPRVHRDGAVQRLLHLQISQGAVDFVGAGEDKRRLGAPGDGSLPEWSGCPWALTVKSSSGSVRLASRRPGRRGEPHCRLPPPRLRRPRDRADRPARPVIGCHGALRAS